MEVTRKMKERAALAVCIERGNGEDVGNYDIELAEAALEAALADVPEPMPSIPFDPAADATVDALMAQIPKPTNRSLRLTGRLEEQQTKAALREELAAVREECEQLRERVRELEAELRDVMDGGP